MSKNRGETSKMSKNDQKFYNSWKKPSKISKNRQKCRKPGKTVKNVQKPGENC